MKGKKPGSGFREPSTIRIVQTLAGLHKPQTHGCINSSHKLKQNRLYMWKTIMKNMHICKSNFVRKKKEKKTVSLTKQNTDICMIKEGF